MTVPSGSTSRTMAFVVRSFDARLSSRCVCLVKSAHPPNHPRHLPPSPKGGETLGSSDKQKVRSRHRVQVVPVASHRRGYDLSLRREYFST